MDRSRSRVVSILAIAALLGGVSTTAATQTAQATPQVVRAASNPESEPQLDHQ